MGGPGSPSSRKLAGPRPIVTVRLRMGQWDMGHSSGLLQEYDGIMHAVMYASKKSPNREQILLVRGRH